MAKQRNKQIPWFQMFSFPYTKLDIGYFLILVSSLSTYNSSCHSVNVSCELHALFFSEVAMKNVDSTKLYNEPPEIQLVDISVFQMWPLE